MIGQLGGVEVAAVGIAGKFMGIYNVVVSAVGAVAGIMISQYMSQKNTAETRRSMIFNLRVCFILATLLSQLVYFVVILGMYVKYRERSENAAAGPFAWGQYLSMLPSCPSRY